MATNDDNSNNDDDDDDHLHSLQPTSMTFLNMMKVLRRFGTPPHMDPALLKQAWRAVVSTCLEKGYLNDICLHYMQQYAPAECLPKAFRSSIGNSNNAVVKDPAWSRNATPEKKRRSWK
jgi:hypothetical protein